MCDRHRRTRIQSASERGRARKERRVNAWTRFHVLLLLPSLCPSLFPSRLVPPILDSRGVSAAAPLSHSPFTALALFLLLFPVRRLCPPVFLSLETSYCRARFCRARKSERNNRVSERDEKYYRLRSARRTERRDEREKRVMLGSSARVVVGVRGLVGGRRIEGCSAMRTEHEKEEGRGWQTCEVQASEGAGRRAAWLRRDESSRRLRNEDSDSETSERATETAGK